MSNAITNQLDDYMSMEYSLYTYKDLDYDYSVYFIAKYTELHGLVGMGNTEAEAVKDLEEAKEGWFMTMMELERPIPLPRTAG